MKMVSNMLKNVLLYKLIPFLKFAESLLFIGGLEIFLAQFKVPKKSILKTYHSRSDSELWGRRGGKKMATKMVSNMVKNILV